MLKRVCITAVLATSFSSTFVSASTGVPAFSVVAPNGQSNILIGSVHVGIDGLLEPDKSIFVGVKRFVIEHHSIPQPGDEGSGEQGRAQWAKDLTDKEIAVYLQRARCAFVPVSTALGYLQRPSVQMANQLAYTICGQSFVPSRDRLLAMSVPPGIPIDTLEDDVEVEAKRRSLPSASAAASFRWILARDPKSVLQGIKDALNKGDYESIQEQVDASLGDAHYASIVKKIMGDQRNAEWMPKLHKYLDAGGAVILVGAMHLPGNNGIISRLRSDGYRVNHINLPIKQ